jgi:hypothetical protein
MGVRFFTSLTGRGLKGEERPKDRAGQVMRAAALHEFSSLQLIGSGGMSVQGCGCTSMLTLRLAPQGAATLSMYGPGRTL